MARRAHSLPAPRLRRGPVSVLRTRFTVAEPGIWLHPSGSGCQAALDTTAAALEAAGMGTCVLDPDSPRGPGTIFFGEPDDSLCALLRAASRGGAERVLAVAVAGAPLVDDAPWRLLRHGAADVLSWDDAEVAAEEVVARFRRWREVDRLVDSPLVRNNLVGDGPAWRALLRQVVEAAAFTDAPVLVTGESGTGKELVARLIHSLDRRPDPGELVVLDCTTVVPELSGSEFFGHERGSFTGATGPREGAFALADGGTLFLDEVGELPLRLQAQLLRAVQEGTYKRVGGNEWRRTRFRLVCATHRDLAADVAAGRFRADLFYRLASVSCRTPPLRERPGDILPLARHFLAELLDRAEAPELDPAVRDLLLRRAYPGNVRDLKQLAARIAARHVGPGPVTAGDLPEEERPAAEPEAEAAAWPDADFDAALRRGIARGVGLKELGRIVAESAIRIAVGDEDGNLQRAARKLGVTDRALQMRRAASRPRSGGGRRSARG